MNTVDAMHSRGDPSQLSVLHQVPHLPSLLAFSDGPWECTRLHITLVEAC